MGILSLAFAACCIDQQAISTDAIDSQAAPFCSRVFRAVAAQSTDHPSLSPSCAATCWQYSSLRACRRRLVIKLPAGLQPGQVTLWAAVTHLLQLLPHRRTTLASMICRRQQAANKGSQPSVVRASFFTLPDSGTGRFCHWNMSFGHKRLKLWSRFCNARLTTTPDIQHGCHPRTNVATAR